MILAIYGTGGAGKESTQIAEYINDAYNRWEKIVFIDDTKPAGMFKNYDMCPYKDFKEKYSKDEVEIHVAVGTAGSKKILSEKLEGDGFRLAILIHPDAVIGNNVSIAPGVQIKMGAIVEDNVVIGKSTWLQAYSIVKKDTVIGDYCHIGAKCIVSEECNFKEMVFLGMHAIISKGIKIDDNVVVGLGAVVKKDIAEDAVVMGDPARVLKYEKTHDLF